MNSFNSFIKYKKEKTEKQNNILDEKNISFDSNNDLLYDNNFNKIKHQDSVVSFSRMKYLSDNKDINKFYLNDNNINNNLKLEKSIDEINQKLSYINNFLMNNYDNKYINQNKSFSSKMFETQISDYNKEENTQNNEKEENRDSKEIKIVKKNISTLTNNFYDSSYIYAANNNKDNINNNKLSNTIDRDLEKKMIAFKTKQIKFNIQGHTRNRGKSSKIKKNNNQFLLNEKENKNNINSKHNTNLPNKLEKKRTLRDINNKEKKENKTKDNYFLNNKIINNTPKLGEKSQRHINEIKPFDLNLNLNIENNFKNNTISAKCDEYSLINLNEEILNGIQKLSSKIIDIERLLQSNNCFKNQAYSIQNEDLFGEIQNEDSFRKGSVSIKNSINKIQKLKKYNSQNVNKDNNNLKSNEKKKENELDKNEQKLIDENVLKNVEESINKIEDNIKNLLRGQFDNFKKYIEIQCMEDIKKLVLDTNFDIMTLCTDKLMEFENILKEKLNHLKF